MSSNLFKNVRSVVLAVAAGVWAMGWGNTCAEAQCCDQGGGHAGHHQAAGSAGHQHDGAHEDHAGHTEAVLRPLHGGQLTIMSPLAFEVVYLPQEIQVYLYGPSQQPESAKDVKGEIALLVRGDNRVLRVPLRYVAPPANAGEPDYLAAAVGVSRLKDGEATATIKLENLPLPHHPAATFAQNVVLSKARLQVTLAAFGPGDQAGVTRQQVCPVTGAKLGSMGTPVKVLIGGQPLYLCCKGCLGKVQSAPDAYLRKAGQASQVQ